MKKWIFLSVLAMTTLACKNEAKRQTNSLTETVLKKDTLKKIDIHAHYRYPRTYFDSLFRNWNMQAVLVDVAIAKEKGVSRSWDNYVAHAQEKDSLFYLCSTFIGVGIDAPNYAKKVIAQLEKEIEQGARMVKVWKNFGMVTKDASGAFIQIDDVRLQPIWDFLTQANIPVMAHIAEPSEAWLPLNPEGTHYRYYKNHPQYHAYNLPEMPSYETIISARDRWIANNPKLSILCAHLGSMSHDVGMVAERLDQFPNVVVELGARFGDLARQDSQTVKSFFERYQDRILFGSDYGNNSDQNNKTEVTLADEMENLDTNYTMLWEYLSSSDSLKVNSFPTKGLGLSKEVLEKIYYHNATRLLKIN